MDKTLVADNFEESEFWDKIVEEYTGFDQHN